MIRILVSSCLLGHAVRYDGGGFEPRTHLRRWLREGRVVALCPECAGGLPTPRPPAEITSGSGVQVLDGSHRVLTEGGEDVSAQFIAGAHVALASVRQWNIPIAILKANSPSCGNQMVYDGSFSGHKVPGEGVTAALLRRHGVQVFNEQQLELADAALAELEQGR